MRSVVAILVLALTLETCGGEARTTAPVPTAPTDATPSPASAPSQTPCPPVAPAAVDPAAVATLGPSPGMDPSPVDGERLILTGIVLLPDCTPAANTMISWWHTDAAGHYGPPAASLECCYFFATFRTDANGRFEIHTIRPATDPATDAELPAHIHVAIGTLATTGPDVGIQFADDPLATQPGTGGRSPRDLLLEVEQRIDDQGSYWFGYAQIVATPPG